MILRGGVSFKAHYTSSVYQSYNELCSLKSWLPGPLGSIGYMTPGASMTPAGTHCHVSADQAML